MGLASYLTRVKIFNNNKITKIQLRKSICKFAKQLGVSRVVFSNKGIAIVGSYNPSTNVLYIDTKQTKTELLHTLFHELGHHTAVKKNKWNNYHHNPASRITAEKIFDIENKIDQIGQKLWYKYVNIKFWGRYHYAYPKIQKKCIIKNFISKQ